MTTEIITALIGIMSAGFSSFFTYIFAKKKYNAEVDSTVIQNMKSLLDFYIKLCDDTNQRVQKYREENEELREQVVSLNRQFIVLKGQICYDTDCMNRTFTEKAPHKAGENGAKIRKKVEKA